MPVIGGANPGLPTGGNTGDVLVHGPAWAAGARLAQAGQTPSQAPTASTPAGSVGSLDSAARADHSHPDTRPPIMPMDTGRWLRLPFVTTSASWSGVPAQTMGFLRFPIGKACSVDAMGVQVMTASAGALARLGIYSDVDGVPTTLLKDFGTIDASSTGYKTASSTAVALEAGWVHLAVGLEGTHGTEQIEIISSAYAYTSPTTLGAGSSGYVGSGYTGGGLPSSASVLTSFAPSLRTFFPWLKVAS